MNSKVFAIFIAVLSHVLSDSQFYVTLDVDADQITLEAIGSTNKSIQCSVYKFTEDTIYKALNAALSRGVDIYIVADKTENDDKDSYVSKLGDNGAKVVFWDTKSRPILHAKFSIFDGERMLVGSANWSNGASENVEIIASSSDFDEVSQVIGIFNQLWTLGTPYIPKQNITNIV